MEMKVRLLLKSLDAQLVGARVETPVEMPEIVARLVVAVVVEFSAVAVKGTFVHAAKKSLDHVTRAKLQADEGLEHFGIEAKLGRVLRPGNHGRIRVECRSAVSARSARLICHRHPRENSE